MCAAAAAAAQEVFSKPTGLVDPQRFSVLPARDLGDDKVTAAHALPGTPPHWCGLGAAKGRRALGCGEGGPRAPRMEADAAAAGGGGLQEYKLALLCDKLQYQCRTKRIQVPPDASPSQSTVMGGGGDSRVGWPPPAVAHRLG